MPTLPLFAAILFVTAVGVAYAGGSGPPIEGPPGHAPDNANFLTRLANARCGDAGPGNGGDNGFEFFSGQKGNSPKPHITTLTCFNGPSESPSNGDLDPGNSQGNANNIP